MSREIIFNLTGATGTFEIAKSDTLENIGFTTKNYKTCLETIALVDDILPAEAEAIAGALLGLENDGESAHCRLDYKEKEFSLYCVDKVPHIAVSDEVIWETLLEDIKYLFQTMTLDPSDVDRTKL